MRLYPGWAQATDPHPAQGAGFSVLVLVLLNQNSWARGVCLGGWFLSKRACQLHRLII